MIYRTFTRYFTSEQAEQQQQVGQHAWARSHRCASLEEQPLEGPWFTRHSFAQMGCWIWGYHRPLYSPLSSSAFCLLGPTPLLLGLPVNSSTTSTQRHDPGRFQAAKQANASSLPCPSSHGSCLNPSWNQMVVNVLLLLPRSRGQSGGNLAAFSPPLLLGAHSPRHWDPWGTASGAEEKTQGKTNVWGQRGPTLMSLINTVLWDCKVLLNRTHKK